MAKWDTNFLIDTHLRKKARKKTADKKEQNLWFLAGVGSYLCELLHVPLVIPHQTSLSSSKFIGNSMRTCRS